MMPKIEVHTINPAKHLRVYIKIKASKTAAPDPARIHFQF
jgi:hypothetical protein